ncbi:MAG: polynucleotide adenylyltransferase/metal dependent phosphohydrolase [Firmicutes bacterium]|nr:polynucleotide adenylyltransferase/metal dependent phosphohydrolase [Bacillota bacterium]
MISQMPPPIRLVIETLEKEGYLAYVVGGAVRDLLGGRPVSDYDVSTDAWPEEVICVAGRAGWRVIDQLGQNFGVVLVVVEGMPIEVATFRGEQYGEDSHRPTEVWYSHEIISDLARRDFTINAMAVGCNGDLIDPFGGQQDLADGVIRAVGDARVRFSEDALRMFRACRFAAQLGFRIDETILNAIPAQLGRAAGLSLERVRDELEKTLIADYCDQGLGAMLETGLLNAQCRIREKGMYRQIPILPELQHLANLPQEAKYHRLDAWKHTLAAMRSAKPDRMIRWAALLHDIGKGLPGVRGIDDAGAVFDHGHEVAGAQLAQEILERLHMPKEMRDRIVWLVSRHMRFYFCLYRNPQAASHWIRQEARSKSFRDCKSMLEAFEQLTDLCTADCLASGAADQAVQNAQAIVEFGAYLRKLVCDTPIHTRDIRYEAEELLSILGDRQMIGPFLQTALHRLQDGELRNDKEAIYAAAKKWISRKLQKMD